MNQQESSPFSVTGPFVGTWTYRSFINNPDIATDFGDLELARGTLVIRRFAPGDFEGRLIFTDTYQFKLTGSSSFGNPFALQFQGVGDTADSQGQIYDYVGYLVPKWPAGVGQRSAIVGSVIRIVAHNGGSAEAGFVGSWIALKRDS
jgi:hypothetical protein